MHLSTFYRKKDPSDVGHTKLMKGVIAQNFICVFYQACLDETVIPMYNHRGCTKSLCKHCARRNILGNMGVTESAINSELVTLCHVIVQGWMRRSGGWDGLRCYSLRMRSPSSWPV